MNTVDFFDLINLFDKEQYDFSYLTKNEMIEVLNHPVKYSNVIENINYGDFSLLDDEIFLVVIKKSPDFNYTVINDIIYCCKKFFPNIQIEEFFCNYKYAAVKAGLGQYAKNSLIYHPRFEFDTHIGVFRFLNYKIINTPIRNSPNYNRIEFCDNCNDCVDKCPVKAIHFENNNTWIDMIACDHFCFFGDDEKIPSIKQNWFKVNGFDISDEELKHINSFKQVYELTQIGMGLESFVNGQFIPVIYPTCRECVSQKCTKYKGNYPYDINKIIIDK